MVLSFRVIRVYLCEPFPCCSLHAKGRLASYKGVELEYDYSSTVKNIETAESPS